MYPVLGNKHARNLFLHLQGLSEKPVGQSSNADLLRLIDSMGFVQIDSINTVERAHHMILFSRNHSYRPSQLIHLLEHENSLFENWTHDASIIPSCLYPYWKHRFVRQAPVLRERWRKWRREGFEERLATVREHVRKNGPTMSRDLKATGAARTASDGWWDWHPFKTALEFLWHTGELAVARREGFQKVYDLSARVLPKENFTASVSEEEFIDWACRSALDRLGFATSGEIAAFWDMISPRESGHWCENQAKDALMQIHVESAGDSGHHRVWARPDILERAEMAPAPPGRIRVLSPFDPVLRDRKRAARLFGFDYRIEVFVPEKKRQYGYYVFPLIEGNRMIGRIDMKCHRKERVLRVSGLWMEADITLTSGREKRLRSAIRRVARFARMDDVVYSADYLRQGSAVSGRPGLKDE